MQQRTLGSLVNRTSGQTVENVDSNFLTFLTLFSINITHRFQTEEIDTIDQTTIENVARLSALCTPIVVETWNEVSGRRQQRREAA